MQNSAIFTYKCSHWFSAEGYKFCCGKIWPTIDLQIYKEIQGKGITKWLYIVGIMNNSVYYSISSISIFNNGSVLTHSIHSVYVPNFSWQPRAEVSLSFACHCSWCTDLREPRQTQSPSLSPITHGISSSSSLPSSRSPLASSLTRSVFHSELKTWLFTKSFPP